MARPSVSLAFRSWTRDSSRFCTITSQKQIHERFFATSAALRNKTFSSSHQWLFSTSHSSHFTSSATLRGNLRSLSEQLLKFRQSAPTWSRVGWYRDGKQDALRRSVRNTSNRDPQWNRRSNGPFERFRTWFDRYPENVLIWSILGINGAVFLGWQYALDRYVCLHPLLKYTTIHSSK